MTYCWEVAGAAFLFHYTEPAAAEAIASEELYVVGGGNLLGCGLYASALKPTEHTPAELLARLFFNSYPDFCVDGVVVLMNDPALPFERPGGDTFLLPAPKGTRIDLSGFVVGHGVRAGSGWRFGPSVFV
jgi:hypothetical protein